MQTQTLHQNILFQQQQRIYDNYSWLLESAACMCKNRLVRKYCIMVRSLQMIISVDVGVPKH